MSLELWEKNRWINIHSSTDGEVTALVETAEHAISQAGNGQTVYGINHASVCTLTVIDSIGV